MLDEKAPPEMATAENCPDLVQDSHCGPNRGFTASTLTDVFVCTQEQFQDEAMRGEGSAFENRHD